jgi:hypothetical protein
MWPGLLTPIPPDSDCPGLRDQTAAFPSRRRRNQIQGKIANTRAGNPEPPFGFGKLTTAIAPASGT